MTDELVETIREILTIENKAQSERFLAVIGPSGVGKSSVVMSGLLPRLRQGVLLGSENWLYLTMIPGTNPIISLASTLASANEMSSKPAKAIYDDLLAEGERGLYWQALELIKAMKAPNAKIVLVVDQFEELFTQSSEPERQLFIDLLVTAATDPQSPVIIIATLRADFYDRPINYPELSKLIELHTKLVPAMDIEELRNVIEKPAALSDVQLFFDEDLVGDLLFEIHGQVGALPLLEFTLDQLFQRRQAHQLTRQAYEEIGGVKGALSKHAEETYKALPSDEHRQLTRALFLRLIEPGVTEQNMTRHRATFSELILPNPEQATIIQEVADAFVHARLLTTNEVGGTKTIEVSHEAVIREWERLSAWVREARLDIPLQHAISKDAREWEQHGMPRDRLYRGSQLKDARGWAMRNFPSSSEIAFLQASTIQRTLTLLGFIIVVFLLIASMGATSWIYLTQPPKPASPTLVTTMQDSVIGSLRWCINNAPSGSTIRFAPNLRGTIELTGGSLLLTRGKQLTIIGLGASQLTISGGNLSAQIDVPEGSTLNISDLSFKNSEMIGYAFLTNEGTLTIARGIISGNKSTNDHTSFGGGIYNTGTLTLRNSIISNNSASSTTSTGTHYGQGGGIDNEGQLTVINSTFMNNTASSNSATGVGGGIFNYQSGTVLVTNSTFSHNLVSGKQNGWGGGIENEGKVTVVGSTFMNNTASSSNGTGSGGGIFNEQTGALIVTNCTFLYNLAKGKQYGQGGIENQGKITVVGSTFTNNIPSNNSSIGSLY